MVRKLDENGMFRIKRDGALSDDNLMILHRSEINRQLKKLGAVKYNMALPETHSLPSVIPLGETIKGIVYGRFNTEHENYLVEAP